MAPTLSQKQLRCLMSPGALAWLFPRARHLFDRAWRCLPRRSQVQRQLADDAGLFGKRPSTRDVDASAKPAPRPTSHAQSGLLLTGTEASRTAGRFFAAIPGGDGVAPAGRPAKNSHSGDGADQTQESGEAGEGSLYRRAHLSAASHQLRQNYCRRYS